ncbi:MAG: PPK2 family polyphosphate kinase [Thermoanaerobaculia bacterium]
MKIEIPPGARVKLKDFDPADCGGLLAGAGVEARMRKDIEALASLHERLFAAQSHSVLIVLQGIDTAGKDGTIRHVFTGVNPQGCRVASFRQPTPEESAHDFLWRVHRETPGLGEIAIFNRSHYEAVLVERVHKLVARKVWKERYEQIREFERLLATSGTLVLKFFLHLSKAEQKRRLEARLADPDKRWKSSRDDWRERRLWKEYRKAFEDMLEKTSTRRAPWFVIPSDVKWYRNLLVARTIVRRLRPYDRLWRDAARRRGKHPGGG